jgi:hypothetical protein
MINRRIVLSWLGAVGVSAIRTHQPLASAPTPGTGGEWQKYPGNPVLGGQYGTCFDICVLEDQGRFGQISNVAFLASQEISGSF